MTEIAVLGAGGGGLSVVAELASAGHRIRLWNRNPRTLERNTQQGKVCYEGVLGTGKVTPTLVTTELSAALAGVDVAVVSLPAVTHPRLFAELAALGISVPLILNPGHTGGALHLLRAFRDAGSPAPPVVEFSTLTHVARVQDGAVRITGRAGRVWAGCLPGGRQALDGGLELFTAANGAPDVLFSSLANVNLVLHPPGSLLGLSWVEATAGRFSFYVDGMTPGVARVVAALDAERRAVAAGFGHEVPELVSEMASIGTADEAAAAAGDVAAAIRGGVANQAIAAPDTTQHRYYAEDLPFGLVPFVALADIAGVQVPVASSLIDLAGVATATDYPAGGLTAHRLGLAGMSRDQVIELVQRRNN